MHNKYRIIFLLKHPESSFCGLESVGVLETGL